LKLQEEIRSKLGDIEPERNSQPTTFWKKSAPRATVEAISLRVEDGIEVPLLLLLPVDKARAPVVVAVSKDGKSRFLANRVDEIRALLGAGIGVCLPDLRGTGETAPEPDWQNDGRNLAEMEVALGNTLMGARVKDLRTVLAFLRTRADLDRGRMALWGESFAPSNPSSLFLDELEQEAGPQIQYHAEPLGAATALLAALFEDDVRAVAARGGLAGYISILENAFAYVPTDSIVPGILKVADIADIASAVAPRPLLLEALIDGRNIRLSSTQLSGILGPTVRAYGKSDASERLTVRSEPGDLSRWLAAQLQ
jgi:pimeloyl-ACP methyl ester carboxylesterase